MEALPQLVDSFGRRIHYLRVSVTDRCQFRCFYCRPPGGIDLAEHRELLTLEEITRLVRLFTECGIERVRLTGGEPLLRRNIMPLVAALAALPRLRELSLSTNALMLARYASDLVANGLKRVNISLDSLNPETFREITRGGDLAPVLAGIEAALRAGLHPVKVNMVVMKGINETEIPAMVEFARENGLILRFIETMPIGEPGQDSISRFVPAEVIRETVQRHFGRELRETRPPAHGNGPARYFRIGSSGGEMGIISALSQHFCEGCNRVRLTSRGRLVLCLGREDRVDLKAPLREGMEDEPLRQRIREAVAKKPERHRLDGETPNIPPHRMSALGG
ncbi:MAG: GTP 3',8-cyclase MoaA [Magnetococcales bacterium]|nr:GTP 3',8-cyclase MoaA [Magnetococcales bacterium]